MRQETFELAGQTITIKYVKDIKRALERYTGKATYVYGFCTLGDNKIYIDEGILSNPDLHEHTRNHELIHAILHVMGRDKLNCNEAFVDLFANLLTQYRKTLKTASE